MTSVCATSQTARALLRQDARERLRRGEKLWETPDVLPWSAWLRRQWDALAADPPDDLPLLLEPLQERLLWEDILSASRQGGSALLDSRAAAKLASAAHGLARAYRIPLQGALYQVNEDTEAFALWQRDFMRRCEREGWVPASALADVLTKHSSKAGVVQLAGFDELSPQQRDLLARHEVTPRPQPALQGHAEARLFSDAQHERTAVAQWAARMTRENPEASIAVLAFDLAAQRASWQEAFARDFPAPYTIAAAEPLAQQPLAASALALMELASAEISVATAGAILLSPYVAGYSTERFARAAMDEKLRRAGGPSLPLWRLARHDVCPQFHARLQSWIAARNELADEQMPSGWAQDFHRLLRHFGWPGDRRLNAREFPVHEAWSDLLATLASLDRVLGPMSVGRARRLLRDLAREATYEPPAEPASVHLIAATEPVCVAYDHIWLAGAHDGIFPPPVSINPFLPLGVQRDYAVPGLAPRDVLERARRWAMGLAAATPDLVVSTATLERKEPRRLSALFAHLPCERVAAENIAWHALKLEELSDTVAPLPAAGAQQGGVRLFEHQAKCPFHAFAELRLGAKELEEPYLGFDKRKQGTALHAALHEFWRQVGDSRKLASLGNEMIEGVLAAAVDKVLTEEWRAETKLRERMREVERERLMEVLRRWIRVEQQRPAFRVLTQEQKAQVALGGLAVNVRADRVDELPDGRVVVVDYKTSAPSIASWSEERIGDPQLPLYAVTTDRHVGAVVFAQVQAEKQHFKGVAEDKQVVKLTKFVQLDRDMLARWREALENVAREYLAGVARVDWSHGACDFCELATLCRKHELRQVAAAGGDDDGA